ncbi:MAG: DHHW family protein, partial [Clostridia bacterium]
LLVFYKKDKQPSDQSNNVGTSSNEPSNATSSTDSLDPSSSKGDDDKSTNSTVSKDESSTSSNTTSNEESSTPDVQDEFDHQWHGFVYRYFGAAFEDFTPSTNSKQAYIDTLNSLYEKIAGNSRFFNLIIPTHVEFAKESFPREVTASSGDSFFNQSQKSFLNFVASKTNEGITNINPIDLFREKYANEEYLYFNTDKNYTALAAYYAYTKFCESAQLEPVTLDKFTELKIDRFLGTFYTQTESKRLEENADYVKFYDIDAVYPSDVTMYKGTSIFKKQKMIYNSVSSVANGYNVFFGQEAYMIDIKTQTKTGKSILVLGDTSAAPFVPFLAAHYEKITFINPTLYNENSYDRLDKFIVGKDFSDILVINYSTSYKSPFFFAANIRKMIGTYTE